jgi:hypothetical protein
MRIPTCNCRNSGTMVAVAVALVTSLLGALSPQEQVALPQAREVIDRYVEALGGKDALASHPGRHAVGTMEVPAQGVTADIEIFSAPPNKMRMNIEIAGMGSVTSGFDGEVAWAINPALGPMVLDGRMLDQLRQQADWQGALHPETFVASAETVEETEFEGQQCYKLKIVTSWEEEYFEFFNAGTGLLVGIERTTASPMGEVPTTTVLSDYREIDGLLVPMKSAQRMLGFEQVVTMSQVTAEELADSVFALPAEIQALTEEAGGQEQSRR